MEQIVLKDEAALCAFAARCSALWTAPAVVYLEGELGAGKTTFARAFIHALGYSGKVKSPTYGLLEEYRLADLNVLHLDLYRIGDAEELEYLGLRDLYDKQTIMLVEWPEKGRGFLPAADIRLLIEDYECGRKIQLYAASGVAQTLG